MYQGRRYRGQEELEPPTLAGEGAEHPQNTANSNIVIKYKLNLLFPADHKQHVSYRVRPRPDQSIVHFNWKF